MGSNEYNAAEYLERLVYMSARLSNFIEDLDPNSTDYPENLKRARGVLDRMTYIFDIAEGQELLKNNQ